MKAKIFLTKKVIDVDETEFAVFNGSQFEQLYLASNVTDGTLYRVDKYGVAYAIKVEYLHEAHEEGQVLKVEDLDYVVKGNEWKGR